MGARTCTARRLLLAAAVGGATLLQLAAFASHPPLGETAAETLAVVAGDPGRWVLTHLVAAASAALSVVSALALAALVRGRGAALATAAAALIALGGGCLAMAFGAEAHLLPLAADASLDRDAMVALAGLEETSPVMGLLLAGMPLSGIGTLLLAVALLRSGAVARWKPALVLVGTVASLGGAPGSAIGPFLLAPAVIGFLALTVDVAKDGRAQPAPPSDLPVPAPADELVGPRA